ncbi:LOW QUALITY PROTEIN: ATP-binding cassette sub-family C member 10-like [Paramacrobiotus metropolitanus]|uniref:LOW QUALITY PROTEIN: ATP-binding cassette sub-family C member 10-like n=1 Tax=Paramacrobiotus metropolitanus TaxID=2943436 RepID=UPI0024461402|nr:LOW QUALITY PROTEIN: ATP-binding cassette sub-family C member 10-like [Paramacrobiotus metropolitanus]
MSDSGGAAWTALCPRFGIINTSFATVWDFAGNDFPFCYERIFSVVVHMVFLIVNAYYIAPTRIVYAENFFGWGSTRNAHRLVVATWILRILISVSIIAASVISMALQLVAWRDWNAFGLVGYVDFGLVVISWSVHVVVAYNLSKKGKHRGVVDGSDTCAIFLSWFPVFLVSSVEFRSAVLHHSPNVVSSIVTMVTFGLHVFYIFSTVLHIYSTCLFVTSPFDSEERARTPPDEADNDTARLLNVMPERTSLVPRLGPPNTWGILRFFLFLWVDPLMEYGAEGHLQKPDDLFELPLKLKADLHAEALQKALAKNLKSSRFYLQQIILRIWGGKWLLLGVMKLAYSFLQYCSPLFVNVLVALIEQPGSQPDYLGYVYGLGLILVNLISNSVQLHYAFQMEKLALCIRGALMDTVYYKLVQVHASALNNNMAAGHVVNLVGTDCQKVSDNIQYLHQLWALPLQMAVALYLLYQQVGYAFIGGVIFTVLLVPLNQLIASKISRQVERNLKERDARVKLMSEALSAIRVIKYYAWEKWFSARVDAVRQREMATVKSIKYLDACCVYFWATTPLIMSVLTFVTYVSFGKQLTAAKVFTCLSVFGLVYAPLNAMPWIITGTVEAWISAKRLQQFFRLSDIDLKSYYAVNTDLIVNPVANILTVHDASFTWTGNESNEILSDSSVVSPTPREPLLAVRNQLDGITLEIRRGELIGIVGKVGSGKTSLLHAVMAELYRTGGSIEISQNTMVNGFAYVPQDNWLQQGTVLSNIKFSLTDVQPEGLQNVIDACALTHDLEELPHGALTQIGDQGVTLSGGQKARIALARAVLQDKDIILMDDPFSAVDAQVANHIFDKCVLGLLKNKTRLLVTHHLDFLRAMDRLIVMQDGHIVENGQPLEILSKLTGFGPKWPGSTGEKSVSGVEGVSGVLSDISQATSRRTSVQEPEPREAPVQLVQEEQREFGSLKLSVYRQYWQAVGNFWSIAVFVSLFLMQASYNATDWWLSYWVTHERIVVNTTTNETQSDVNYYLTVYGSIGAGNSFFALIRSFVFAYAGLRAAYRMHDSLLSKVMRAKMMFFDTTPSGRILNRFAKDVTSVDSQLPFNVNILLACIFQLVGILIVICYGLPWFIIVLVPIIPLYFFIQRFYRSTSREIKRVSTLAQSPIFGLYAETVHGLSTIRVMRATEFFYKKYKLLLDDYLRSQFAEIACNKWLSMRLQLLGIVIVSGVVVIALLVKSAAGVLGLTVSYSLTIVGILNGFVMSLIETEKELVSVERVIQYLDDIEEEKYDGLLQAPRDWPQLGAVDFNTVSLRYRNDLPLVLKGISLQIPAGKRIGVVGRTGAGKSSFLATLFRVVEIEQGAVSIDGVNLATLPLEQLRSRLAIIPQTPNLFDASIRENIDPLHQHTDEEVWAAIDLCDLRDPVGKLGGHLDVMLGENGRKLSLGQKQLVCLARAIMTKAKVLCLDEATASIDYETDQKMQRTIREAFAHSTVITIAHRLHTVMDYDRIIVMSDGKIVETDSPSNLLRSPSSHFAMLYQQSQRSIADTVP